MFSVGGKAGAPRVSFAALMNGLRSASGASGGPNIRIGGNSADTSAYVPASEPLPAGDSYRITDADFACYAATVPAWNGSVVVDVSLRDATNATLSVNHLTAAARVLAGTRLIEAVEVGNEVDLYSGNKIRNSSYHYDNYKTEFAR